MLTDLSKILFQRMQELREESGGKLDINNIDSLVGNIITVLKTYITNQSDLNIYNEVVKLYEQIHKIKSEVVTFKPSISSQSSLPGATMELAEVTKSAEKSANTILDSAEAIQSLLEKVENKEVKKQISEHIMHIFEACNFQDLAGQRITKVLKVLDEFEHTVNNIMSLFSNEGKAGTTIKKDTELTEGQRLISGPQNSDQAPSQLDIDKLFGNDGNSNNAK